MVGSAALADSICKNKDTSDHMQTIKIPTNIITNTGFSRTSKIKEENGSNSPGELNDDVDSEMFAELK